MVWASWQYSVPHGEPDPMGRRGLALSLRVLEAHGRQCQGAGQEVIWRGGVLCRSCLGLLAGGKF